jgi:hypothetical protein
MFASDNGDVVFIISVGMQIVILLDGANNETMPGPIICTISDCTLDFTALNENLVSLLS